MGSEALLLNGFDKAVSCDGCDGKAVPCDAGDEVDLWEVGGKVSLYTESVLDNEVMTSDDVPPSPA